MSSERGNVRRIRAQKHRNTTKFVNDLHDHSRPTKELNEREITSVCQHCKEVIEWKIRYKKYKALTAPRKCIKCETKSVKYAYHVVCTACILRFNICAKCGKKEGIVEKPKLSASEEASKESQFQKELKALPERKRRTLLRYMCQQNPSDYLAKEINKVNISVTGSDAHNSSERESGDEESCNEDC